MCNLIIIAWPFRQRADFTDGTSRQKKSGQNTMSRRKLCRRQLFSLGLRCRMGGRQESKTRTKNSPMSSTRSTRYLPVRRPRRARPLLLVMAATLRTKPSLVRSFGCEATWIKVLARESLVLGNVSYCI